MNYNAKRTYTVIFCGQNQHRIYLDSRGQYHAEAALAHPTIESDVENLLIALSLTRAQTEPGCVSLLAFLRVLSVDVRVVLDQKWKPIVARYFNDPLVKLLVQQHVPGTSPLGFSALVEKLRAA